MPCCPQGASTLFAKGNIKQGNTKHCAAPRSPLANHYARHILTRECMMICFWKVGWTKQMEAETAVDFSGNNRTGGWSSRPCYQLTACLTFKASLTSSEIVTLHLPQEPLWRGSNTLHRQVQVGNSPANLRDWEKLLDDSTNDISVQVMLSCERSVLCRIFSNIPGIYLLHASGTHTSPGHPSHDNQKCVLMLLNGHLKGSISPSWEPLGLKATAWLLSKSYDISFSPFPWPLISAVSPSLPHKLISKRVSINSRTRRNWCSRKLSQWWGRTTDPYRKSLNNKGNQKLFEINSKKDNIKK